MTNGLTRGVPVQHQLENQDPAVLYNVNEVTGEVSAIVGVKPASAGAESKGKKRAATPKAAGPAPVVEEEDVDAAGEGE